MSGVLTSPTWLVHTFCSFNVPLTTGKGDGLGLSGELEQADNTARLAKASQRVRAEFNKVVTWRFLRRCPGLLPGDPDPRH